MFFNSANTSFFFSMLDFTSLYIARRYVRSGSSGKLLAFATWFAFGSVALGSMALILALAILGGFERELSENAVKFTAHIEVTGFNKRTLAQAEIVRRLMKERIPNIRAVSAFVQAEGLARSKTFIDGVMIKGIVPETDVAGVRANMIAGAFAFSTPEAREVIIGAKMARKLGLSMGGTLTIYSTDNAAASHILQQSQNPAPIHDSLPTSAAETMLSQAVVEQFVVVGVFETGMSEYDDVYVYVPFRRAVQLFRLPVDAASGFDVVVHDIRRVQESSAAIDSLFGYPFFPMTLYEKYNDIFAWIDLQKQPVPLVLGLITIVAVFNIIATLLMAVVQKMSSIGVLRAMGMEAKHITRVFLLQGVFIGGAGSIAGCSIALILCALQAKFHLIRLQGSIYFMSYLPIEFAWQHYALVIGLSLAMSLLAAWIPARIGGKIPLLRALRFQ
ncbi:MAG: ABC transporter permease [Candidatus Kapaibacterium sp.]|nr:MAG: ABC transporter permease [Candidatus Kapabacteria bacterium]